jgi:hypothetical protein
VGVDINVVSENPFIFQINVMYNPVSRLKYKELIYRIDWVNLGLRLKNFKALSEISLFC